MKAQREGHQKDLKILLTAYQLKKLEELEAERKTKKNRAQKKERCSRT